MSGTQDPPKPEAAIDAAVRGNPIVTLTNETTLLPGPVRAHSQKPEEFYALVERLCPAPQYAELFARTTRPGWDGHGDEVAASATLIARPTPATATTTL
jgi:N6-adenosine-specific RNA methylase IME4